MAESRTKLFAIEGNIGCGKTSFLKIFEDEYQDKVKVFLEPLEKWRNVGGHNLLELMYRDPKKWSFALQQYVQLTMYQVHEEMASCDSESHVLKMCERSLLSARNCFVELQYRAGNMSRVEYEIIDQWYVKLTTEKKAYVDGIIYLECPPEVCLERLKERGRSEEQFIDLTLLSSLGKIHEEWLNSARSSIKILRVNADISLAEMRKSCANCYEVLANNI